MYLKFKELILSIKLTAQYNALKNPIIKDIAVKCVLNRLLSSTQTSFGKETLHMCI